MKVSIGSCPDEGDQEVDVYIDEWDTWNMDVTLSHIIAPMLVQLKETKHGYPANLTQAGWDEILDEMIWAFEYKSKNFDSLMDDNHLETQARLSKAFKMFGQYYEHLWD